MTLKDSPISVIVLGIAQDAGVPHVGCRCIRCQAAYSDPSVSQYAASLAIVDGSQNPAGVWLVDATPDIKYQLNLLRDALGPHSSRPDRLRQPDGLFLTHGHMGHTAGLAQFGPEGMAVEGLKLYASSGLSRVLRESRLWTPLVKNLALVDIEPNRPLALTARVTVTPIPVPHRDEFESGTFAYRIDGQKSSLLYLPDIDSWSLWPEANEILTAVDVALVDASFYSRNELSGRDHVAHPLVPETLEFFQEIPTRLVFTHLNHTNPLLDRGSNERKIAESQSAEVAFTGQLFEL